MSRGVLVMLVVAPFLCCLPPQAAFPAESSSFARTTDSDASEHRRIILVQSNPTDACADVRHREATRKLLARNPSEEARLAAEKGDFRLMGYMTSIVGALRIYPLGTDCPKRPAMRKRRYREIVGLEMDHLSQCLHAYRLAAKRFVASYNRALVVHAAGLDINLCALDTKTQNLKTPRKPFINTVRD